MYIFLKINKKHAEIKYTIVNRLFLSMASRKPLMATNQSLILPVFEQYGYTVSIKREDLVFPLASGNKWRKLNYNIEAYKQSGASALLTFGGAYSNHLAATAALCAQEKIRCVGIVRGDELAHKPLNPTLEKCQQNGMELMFVSREEYTQKEQGKTVQEVRQARGTLFLLPEGGTNALAVKGCKEILTPQDAVFDTICCAVGTGGTLAGLALAAAPHQKVIGLQVVKDVSIQDRIRTFVSNDRWTIVPQAVSGKYAQVDASLVAFATDVFHQTGVLLDPVYTAPMLARIVEMIKNKKWTFGKNMLLIHTGGTQGIAGFNSKHHQYQWPSL